LLTEDRLAAVRGLRAASAPSFRALVERCDEDSRTTIESGYEAWDWANATLDLALYHAVTRRPDYARAAIRYFRALLDDHVQVGDGAGGDAVVHHDDGYSIRTRGCLGAIAYDWLHDVPGMTPELRSHAVDRFMAWTTWFSENGYNREEPIANYYMGWFGAVAFGGIAADGDDPRAALLLRLAARMFNVEVVPAYRKKLAGGDFPEGWQYGDLVGSVLAIFADAEARAATNGPTGRSPFDELPWLRESPTYRMHALWPDGTHTFDTGDWSDKPAVSPTHMLLTLGMVLPPIDAAGRRARSLARSLRDPHEEWRWLAALGDDPSRVAEDIHAGPMSYLSPGTASVTARTDWSPDAIWTAMASAPSLSDHQHLDAGHFEIVRGADALVIDAGGYGSYSSLSHNVIAVDDGKDNDNYSPNQGTWSDSARIARFEDSGRFVYALADYASAYNPAGYPADHPQRSVARAEREIVLSRSRVSGNVGSARVIVYDRITLTKPSYGVTFLLHGGAAPESAVDGVRFVVGKSSATVTTLVPAAVGPVLVREPTDLGDGPYYANEPPEDTASVRVEVRSPRGDLERRFLHAFVVGAALAKSPAPVRIESPSVQGAAIEDEAYLFARGTASPRGSPIAYRAPSAISRHFIASLAPDSNYAVTVEGQGGGSCGVSLDAPGDGTAPVRRASKAGVLVLEVDRPCALR
jgi:hypothetical protein